MRPRDWFSVGVRLLGVWIIYDGFVYLLAVLSEGVSHFSRSGASRSLTTESTPSIDYTFYAVGALGFGFVLISGAERLTRWAFNEPSPAEDESPAPEH
jgi:hypothetical protein